MGDETFGHYLLEELLGRGGMGEVYRALDTRKQRTVALKRLPQQLAADIEFQARFRRESATAARLRDPHVIPIHDFGEIDGRLFIDMRLVEGVDLAEVIRRHPDGVELERALNITSQIADALDAAHADGLVHRDVKPSNILLAHRNREEADDRSQDFCYLIDFGIARASSGPASATITQNDAAIGTPTYMAPERLLGEPSDHRVDVYALTCVLFELLTGRPPFSDPDQLALMYAHVHQEPPRPTSVRADLPPALDDVVARGMAKAPDLRFETAGALAAAARATLSQSPTPTWSLIRNEPPIPAEPQIPAAPPTPVSRRRRIVPALAAAVLVVGAVAVGVAFGGADPAATPGPTSSDSSPTARPEVVLNTVPVGLEPRGVAVTPDGRRALVTNGGADTVSVIDIGAGSVTAVIPVGRNPSGVGISADGRRAYVANTGSAEVSVIDIATDTVTTTVPVGASPTDIALTPDGRFLYVVNFGSSNLSVIDTTDNRLAATVVVDPQPAGVAMDPAGRWAYVASNSGTISQIDIARNEVRSERFVGDEPRDLAVSPDGMTLFVTNADSHTLSLVDTSTGTVTKSVPVDNGRPFGVALTPDGRRAYVTNSVVGTLSVVDTTSARVVATLPVGNGPYGVAVAPDGRRAFVVNTGSGTVSVIEVGR